MSNYRDEISIFSDGTIAHAKLPVGYKGDVFMSDLGEPVIVRETTKEEHDLIKENGVDKLKFTDKKGSKKIDDTSKITIGVVVDEK